MKALRLSLFAITGLIILFTAVASQAYEVGEMVNKKAYCIGEDAVKELIVAVSSDNDEGYNRTLNNENINCVDIRFNIPVTPLKILGLYARVIRADGEIYDFWKVVDINGVEAYIWEYISAMDDDTTPKDGTISF